MDDLEKASKEDPGHYHYYGDDIRKIFIGLILKHQNLARLE